MGRIRLTEKIAADKKKPAKREEKRDVRESGRYLDGFDYDTSKAKILKNALHNLNVALGTMLGALKDLALLRGSDITPDGKLGGRGFVMEFKEIKMNMTQMVSNLSDITDTIGDELTNPKWGLNTKEIKKIKEEKEHVEDKAEEVSGVAPVEVPAVPTDDGLQPPLDQQPSIDQQPPMDQQIPPVQEGDTPESGMSDDSMGRESKDSIKPEDVKDSVYVEALKRYKKLFNKDANQDAIAKILKKSIQANLLK